VGLIWKVARQTKGKQDREQSRDSEQRRENREQRQRPRAEQRQRAEERKPRAETKTESRGEKTEVWCGFLWIYALTPCSAVFLLHALAPAPIKIDFFEVRLGAVLAVFSVMSVKLTPLI
jgi:hypothetical protein